jgi:integrase
LRRGADGYFRTQWVTTDGRRHGRSFGNVRTEAEADFSLFFEQWISDPRVREPDGTEQLTVGQLFERFRRHAEHYYRRADGTPTGEARNFVDAVRSVETLFGGTLACAFGPKALKTARGRMVAASLSINTINAYVRRIRQVFKWAVGEELVPAAVWHGLQAVQALAPGRTEAIANTPVGPVPEAHIHAVTAVLPATVAAMVDLQFLTGARPGEVCAMRPIDVDVSAAVWVYRPAQHKSLHVGKQRVVLMGPKAQEVVQPYLRRSVTRRCFTPGEAMQQRYASCETHRRPDQRAAPRKTRRRVRPYYVTDTYARAISRACDEVGVPRWSPNQLRHNAATRLRQEFGLDVAQVILGHASADVTQIYAERDLARAMAVMEKIG